MKKPLIIAGVAAVAILALGYFFVMPMVKGKAAAAPTPSAASAGDNADPGATPRAQRKKHATEPGLMYPLAERVLNLAASPTGGTHFARIQLTLEFDRPATGPGSKPPAAGAAAKSTAVVLEPGLEPVTARKAQIDDAIVRIFGAKTFEMMTSTDGREQLKQDIIDAIGEIVPSPNISAVYINNLIVQ